MNSNRNKLIYLAILFDGDYDAILSAVKKYSYPSDEAILEEVNKLKCQTLTILDEDYPQYLKNYPRSPFVLFYYGDISLINAEHLNSNLGVVGTRKATSYGLYNTKRIVRELNAECTIVSGLAKGIDAAAHQAAIDSNAKTVAVLGSGIDNVWPLENEDLYHSIIEHGGLVVSEYPNMSEPLDIHFPVRNRLIVMFSNAILVTEAHGYRTGTAITVKYAMAFNKLLMSIPYPLGISDSYCNHLLHEGVQCVRNVKDVLLEMDVTDLKII